MPEPPKRSRISAYSRRQYQANELLHVSTLVNASRAALRFVRSESPPALVYGKPRFQHRFRATRDLTANQGRSTETGSRDGHHPLSVLDLAGLDLSCVV